ncbi:hypothetical protein [Luteolibacter marinus]|uniref:hypothetical protein n=1 Tax=Luteolibacter marinus TaxID=2776705 RepID=UPI001868DA61|nr:hypothetical protein [Luteolibacter marinus]
MSWKEVQECADDGKWRAEAAKERLASRKTFWEKFFKVGAFLVLAGIGVAPWIIQQYPREAHASPETEAPRLRTEATTPEHQEPGLESSSLPDGVLGPPLPPTD